MKYKTIKIIKKETTNNILDVFDKIQETDKLISDFLNKPYCLDEISSFIKEEIDCPNGCSNTMYYIIRKYFTEDKRKQILCVKCVHCGSHLLVFQENFL